MANIVSAENQPDMLTNHEAQKLFDASFDMLDALESLVLYQSEIGKEDLTLDVWKNAIAAIKKAGGIVYA